MIDARIVDAWTRGYALLGRLFVRGVRAEDLASLEQDASLWDALPKLRTEVDLDAVGADHYALFERLALPYEGVYRSPEAVVGANGARLADRLHQLGLAVPHDAPDHLGHLLVALATLLSRGDLEGARSLLGAHILPWTPAVAAVLLVHGDRFFVAATELALALLDHTAQLLEVTCERDEATAWDLDPDDGVDALARSILTPTIAGAMLTARDLTSVSKELQVPAGFVGREQTLKNLVRGAADFSATPTLLEALAVRFERYVERYEAVSAAHAALEPAAASWSRRATHSVDRLRSFAEVVREAG